MKQHLTTALTVLVALAFVPCVVADDPVPAKPPTFRLPDPRTGKMVALDDFQDRKAVVLLFLGTECPVNNLYLPALAELHREYGSRGVQFLGINSNTQDPAPQVAEHARKHELPFPVLKDEGNVVADRLNARKTPEAVLLDADRKVRYRGRIDDRFGVGFQRSKPTRRDLALALDAVLAGKQVETEATEVAGCYIGRVPRPKGEGKITFTRHIAPILQNHCQECHRPDAIGPMALETYADVVPWAETIQEVVSDGRMPPWHADPRYGKFSNDRRMPDEARARLLEWLADGCPKGDDADLPAPKKWASGWQIRKPDLVLDMGTDFRVPADTPKGGIPYKYFFIDPGFKQDQWVVEAEARAGAPSVVHHIIVFINPPGQRFLPGGPGGQVLCGTAPGDMPYISPEGMAKRIPAGSKLVFQMHYTPNGKEAVDRSQFGMVLAKTPPKHEVRTIPVHNLLLNIPAGADNHAVEAVFNFRRDAHILNYMPHMHLRGKDFRYEAIYPDGRTETLLNVPRFDFNWQSAYRNVEPVAMPKGTRLRCVAHYDNSAKNPSNPDPTTAVRWGDQTWEEMMIGWIDFYYDQPRN